MAKNDIYKDIAARTGGDIYIGVVGPVRTGKSTFIKRFMEALNVAIFHLPKPILDNMVLARREYNKTPKDARGENFLESYDKFFYDNEELLDDLILKIAKGHI